jgi:hypothetical protein
MDLRIARALCGFAHELDDPERAMRLMAFALLECWDVRSAPEYVDAALKHSKFIFNHQASDEILAQVRRIMGLPERPKHSDPPHVWHAYIKANYK